MKLASFDSYVHARDEALACHRRGSRHPGMKGVEYRAYFYWGRYHLWRGRSYDDFPECKGAPVFSVEI